MWIIDDPRKETRISVKTKIQKHNRIFYLEKDLIHKMEEACLRQKN